MKSKIKTSAIVTAVGVLLTASGITGYQLVKTKNYGAIEKNLHEVTRVIDGDTFEVKGENENNPVEVRILNIDTPERGECYYAESKKALQDLIGGKKVRLTKDVSGEDSFGRLLRHVFLPSNSEKEDDLVVSKYLIEKGFARAMPIYPNVMYKEYLSRFEDGAIRKGAGVWGGCKNNLPKSFASSANAQPNDVDCVIKGNISRVDKEKRYFLPTCPSYSQIKIDLRNGEAYFCSERDAKSAGFKISDSCDNIF